MKRTLLSLVGILVSLASFALSKDSANAVTMLDYEQAWNDDTGRLSLKNNTKEPIEDVAFQITYINMEGQTIGSEDFNKDVYIAPGEAKTVEIPAFRYDDHYAYYKSIAKKDAANIFIIRFDLMDYNRQNRLTAGEKDLNNDTTSAVYHSDESLFHRLGPIAWLGLYVILAGAMFGLYVIVAVMANKRHRNAALWILISFITTPLLVIFILLIIGKAYDRNNEEDYIR